MTCRYEITRITRSPTMAMVMGNMRCNAVAPAPARTSNIASGPYATDVRASNDKAEIPSTGVIRSEDASSAVSARPKRTRRTVSDALIRPRRGHSRERTFARIAQDAQGDGDGHPTGSETPGQPSAEIPQRSSIRSVQVLTCDNVEPGNSGFWQSCKSWAETTRQERRLRLLGLPDFRYHPALLGHAGRVDLQPGGPVTFIRSRIPSELRIHRVVLRLPKTCWELKNESCRH